MEDNTFLDDISALHQFMRSFYKQCNPLHVKHDMNKTQAQVLVEVARHKDNTMSRISEKVGLEKGSFTTVVDSLIEKGYLERARSAEDRRKILLQLTPEGEQAAQMIQGHMEHHMGRMFQSADEETLNKVKEAVHVLAEFTRNYKR